jgi:CBS-domain-containing membrane protein
VKKSIREFRLFWKHYLFQSLFATFGIFIVLLISQLHNLVIVASIGASTFIVFTMPKYITAQPRNLMGGHVVGLLCGTVCSLIPHSSFLSSVIVNSIAVGLSIFMMVITDTEHPPASGTALGVVVAGFSLKITIGVMASAIILSLIHHIFKQHLKDLV